MYTLVRQLKPHHKKGPSSTARVVDFQHQIWKMPSNRRIILLYRESLASRSCLCLPRRFPYKLFRLFVVRTNECKWETKREEKWNWIVYSDGAVFLPTFVKHSYTYTIQYRPYHYVYCMYIVHSRTSRICCYVQFMPWQNRSIYLFARKYTQNTHNRIMDEGKATE